jgi:hypothetical protein
MVVLAYRNGLNGGTRSLAGWSTSTEISYNGGALMSSCGGLTPFLGTFVLAITP